MAIGLLWSKNDGSIFLRSARLCELADNAVRQARRAGASDAILRISEADSSTLQVRAGRLDTARQSHSTIAEATVYFDGKAARAAGSDLSPRAIAALVEEAAHRAGFAQVDEFTAPADSEWLEKSPPDLDLYHPWDLSVERAVRIARVAEESALDAQPRWASSDGASVATQSTQLAIATSRGFVGGYAGSLHTISCSIVATEPSGKQAGDWSLSRRTVPEARAAVGVGVEAARRAVSRLGARQVAGCDCPVLFEAPVGAGLVEALVAAVSGSAQWSRETFLLDSIGADVAAPHLTLLESAREARGLASAPFDRDGVRTRDRIVVRDGRLEGYFLSAYDARRLKRACTGHGNGSHNLTLLSDRTSPDDDLPAMLGKLHRGLFVTETMGQGTNALTGDFSVAIKGFWVDHGQIVHPVEEMTIAGNMKDMLREIVAVGSDVHVAPVRNGSILVENMKVAGHA